MKLAETGGAQAMFEATEVIGKLLLELWKGSGDALDVGASRGELIQPSLGKPSGA